MLWRRKEKTEIMRKTWKKRLVSAAAALAIAGTVFMGQVTGAKAIGGVNCWIENGDDSGDGENASIKVGGQSVDGAIVAHVGPYNGDDDPLGIPAVMAGKMHVRVSFPEAQEQDNVAFSFDYNDKNYAGTVNVVAHDMGGGFNAYYGDTVIDYADAHNNSSSSSNPSSSSSSSHSSHPAHVHNMVMTVIKEATENEDGLMALKCDGKKCNLIDHSSEIVIPRQSVTANKNMQLITNAKAGEPIVLDTKDSYSFNQYVIAELMKRPECPVTWNFTYENKSYTMTVPAGTDWTAALNDNGWAGFKNVAALNGVSLVENSK